MENKLKQYKDYKKLMEKYNYALFIMSFDQATDCPKNDKLFSIEVQEFFQKKVMDIITSKEYQDLIIELYQNKNQFDDEVLKLDLEIEYKDLEKINRIPKEELFAHYENMNRSGYEWEVARETLDYSKFLIELEELVSYYKKYIKWQETAQLKGFNVLIDEMEEGFTEEMYDEFFEVIEQELVPFINVILTKKPKYNPKLDTLTFDIDKQKKLTKKLAMMMEYDDSVGCIRETVHPFTNWANCNDVRITTNYNEKLLISNLYSVMHEIGHALFQLQMDPKYNGTSIFGHVTCATHESQSRFYENYLGRSKAFVNYLYRVLKEIFPFEFEGITSDDIYYYVNDVKTQMKRIEADELTYPIHILIRYKVEKKLFHDEITVSQIDETFNYYMHKYLGLTPKNMKEGCFQDVHWSSSFAYFPTYALGSAFGAQFIKAMKKDIDVDKALAEGDFKPINAWLKEHIHQYSGTKRNVEFIRDICHEEFKPIEYVNYLKDKFSEIYLK